MALDTTIAGVTATLPVAELRSILEDANNRTQGYRDVMAYGRDFLYQSYRAGVAASVLIQLQTTLTDFVLLDIWSQIFSDEDRGALALMAVGGYGRGELHPQSDIDIALVLKTPPTGELAERLSSFVTQLWDLGLTVGHSVRTIEQCYEEAGADVTVVTNLMEARLLAGSSILFADMRRVIAPDSIWDSQSFFNAKIAEQKTRREKFQGNDAYRLEPNLKESAGGLRDLQTIFWVSQRQFGTRQWDDLITQGLLTADEFETLMNGLEFLWKVRYLVHRLAGRPDDRLLFDYQREIAHEFGFSDQDPTQVDGASPNHAIEQLMQMYFRHVTDLQRLNEIILQGFGGIISGVTAATEPVQVHKRFQVRNGFLEVVHDNVFNDYPPALLEIFLVYSNTPEAEKIRANTVRLIQQSLPRINRHFRDDLAVRDLFVQIFQNPNKITRCIRMMTRYGVLESYLPAFAKIVGRMQYDLFHIYTVDEHTTRVIRNLRRFELPEFDNDLPHCTQVMKDIPKKSLLYLAGLFHDIAKGRNGDHSVLGAEDALTFCLHHGLGTVDSGLVSWVVRHHLIMSTTAQRKDISDPEVIHEFATQVSSVKHLNHLYLLTVADIRGTNPELWNSFKENLLRSLYEATALMLQRGLANPVDKADVIEQVQRDAQPLIRPKFRRRAAKLWTQFPDTYFLQYYDTEIARHTNTIIEHHEPGMPLVMVTDNQERGSTEITLYTPDDNALFALITMSLDTLNLDILSATISTTANNYALDSFYVLEDNGDPVSDLARIDQLKESLVNALIRPGELPPTPSMRHPRRLKHFLIKPRLQFDNTVTEGLTSLYIEASDRPGILATIGRCFMDSRIQVHNAHIATLGDRIEDVFFITNAEGEPLTDEAEIAALTNSLMASLPHESDSEPGSASNHSTGADTKS